MSVSSELIQGLRPAFMVSSLDGLVVYPVSEHHFCFLLRVLSKLRGQSVPKIHKLKVSYDCATIAETRSP